MTLPLCLALGLAALPTLTAAFGTVNEPFILGQHNEHEMITRLAFQCPSGEKSDGICFEPRSLDMVAGYHVNILGVPITGAGFNGAVGSPDTLDPVPEGPEAHCDDADFLDVPGYPQSRVEATARLQACVDHLRTRFRQGLNAAKRLLDERRRIQKGDVDIDNDCRFAFPDLQSESFGRAKCSAIEGFGRALHGIQDFYSHSNWVDIADPTRAISVSNPPGLGLNGTAPFLDMRSDSAIPPDQIPHNLTTGCFSIPDTEAGSGECEGRITHHALSKDTGIIMLDGTFGEVGCSPRCDAAEGNFHRAVLAAIEHSRDAWETFRDELRREHGTVSGNLIICALVRDDPVQDCRNRTLAIAIDNSEAPAAQSRDLETALVNEINSRLTPHGLDRIAVLEYNMEARLVYPMGYPIHTDFELSPPHGQLQIASGLELGIAETIYAQPETYTDRGAVLLLNTGAEDANHHESTVAQLQRAWEEGIRVHYVCISTHTSNGQLDAEPGQSDCLHNVALIPAILKTGGIVAFLDPSAPKLPGSFANQLTSHGLTATDDTTTSIHTTITTTTTTVTEGNEGHTRLYPGITLADLLSADEPSKTFLYPVSAGERLNLTVASVALDGIGAEGCFSVTLWRHHRRESSIETEDDAEIATHTRCGDAEPLVLAYGAEEGFELVVMAEYEDAIHGGEVLLRREEIVFTVAVGSSMPEKDETNVARTTSVVSSTSERPGSATLGGGEGELTSETVEVEISTATVGGGRSTSTGVQTSKVSGHGEEADYKPSFEACPMCDNPRLAAMGAMGGANGTEEVESQDVTRDTATEPRIAGG